MISLKNSSPSRIVLSHNTGASGRLVSHQNSVRSATYELTLASRAPSYRVARSRIERAAAFDS